MIDAALSARLRHPRGLRDGARVVGRTQGFGRRGSTHFRKGNPRLYRGDSQGSGPISWRDRRLSPEQPARTDPTRPGAGGWHNYQDEDPGAGRAPVSCPNSRSHSQGKEQNDDDDQRDHDPSGQGCHTQKAMSRRCREEALGASRLLKIHQATADTRISRTTVQTYTSSSPGSTQSRVATLLQATTRLASVTRAGAKLGCLRYLFSDGT